MFLFLFWQNLKDYGDDEIPCCIWGERQDYKSTGVFLWAYVQLDYFSTLDKTHKNSSLFELLTVKKLPLISYSQLFSFQPPRLQDVNRWDKYE